MRKQAKVKTAGFFILIIGLLMSVYTGFTFITKEEVIDLGNVQITKDNQHTISWEPYFGLGLVVVGGALLYLGKKK